MRLETMAAMIKEVLCVDLLSREAIYYRPSTDALVYGLDGCHTPGDICLRVGTDDYLTADMLEDALSDWVDEEAP